MVTNRRRHGTGTMPWKIFSSRVRVPEFLSPRDSPPKLSPGNPRHANLSPGPSPRSRIFQFWVPVPNPGFSDFASRSRSSPYQKAVELNIMISGIILFVRERLSAKDHFQLETAERQKPSLKLKSYHNPSFQITSQFIWNHRKSLNPHGAEIFKCGPVSPLTFK